MKMSEEQAANSVNAENAQAQNRKRTFQWLRKVNAKVRTGYSLLAGSILAAVVLSMMFPPKRGKFVKSSAMFFKEMITVLPSVLVLMGLFTVWVKRETVVRFLGQGSGISGILIGIFLGTLPTGPLYIAFPLASMLLRKGARIATVMAFLSAWACIKIPQELMEIQFLGIRFTLLRLTATIVLLIPMVLFAEAMHDRKKEEKRQGDTVQRKNIFN